MKTAYKIKLSSARNVKTIIKMQLIIAMPNAVEEIREVRELHLSYDLEIKKGERIFLQGFPCVINELYTDIKNGHIYKVAIVEFRKKAMGEQPKDELIKDFNSVYIDIVKGLKSNEEKN